MKIPCESVSDFVFNFQDSRPMFSPHYQQHSQSPASTMSPGCYKDDEPRKRAPRALTGRYVRTGTAASPRVLQILRKKVEDRLKLKELLGENSHLYFGATNKQQPQYKPLNQKIKKKFWKTLQWSFRFLQYRYSNIPYVSSNNSCTIQLWKLIIWDNFLHFILRPTPSGLILNTLLISRRKGIPIEVIQLKLPVVYSVDSLFNTFHAKRGHF